MNDETVITVEGLVMRYGTAVAVRDVNLAVRHGEVVGLIGPDGAGKSSTLRVIGGLQRPAAGGVTVLGRDAWRHRRAGSRPKPTSWTRCAGTWTRWTCA